MSALATEKFTEIQIKLLRKPIKSLRAWALTHGEPVGSVYNAIKGTRNGKRSKAIRRKFSRYINEPTSGTN
jgi:hypothetical protein